MASDTFSENVPPVLKGSQDEPNATAAFLAAALAYANAFCEGAVSPERADLDVLLESLRGVRAPSSALAETYIALAIGCYKMGMPMTGVEPAQAAIRICRAVNDQRLLARAHCCFALTLQTVGDLKGVREHHSASLEVARAAGNVDQIVGALLNLATNFGVSGEWTGARQLANEALDTLKLDIEFPNQGGNWSPASHQRGLEGVAQFILGACAEQEGNLDEAARLIRIAIELGNDPFIHNYDMVRANQYARLAAVEARAGRIIEAREAAKQGRALAKPGSVELLTVKITDAVVLIADGHGEVGFRRLKDLLDECRVNSRNALNDALTYLIWAAKHMDLVESADIYERELRATWAAAQRGR